MRTYDKSKPLIIIHIPKAAGTSTMRVFKKWFRGNFHTHYFNEPENKLPERLNLTELHSVQSPLALHGHFNKLRGFGIEEYYPAVDQFVTILRDPYELHISHYFYVRKVGSTWRDKSRVPTADLETYLKTTRPNMLNHFPREMNMHNYKDMMEEFFIEIGITEKLIESMHRIGKKLGFIFDEKSLKKLNQTARDQELPDSFKDQFVELYRLEHEVYQYALSRYL